MKSWLQSAMSGGLSRALRIAQLGAVRVTASATNSLQRKARHLEAKLDGLDKGLAVRPISDIAWPSFDLAKTDDPVKEILTSREFETATQFFKDNPAAERSLVSGQAQALLYSVIRNLRPDHVFEIGSYKAGTTEALCRALHANGHGLLHTVDPFRGDYVAATIAHWPTELLRHVSIHPMSSMDFYMEMERQSVRPGVVFVDGNHDYEFALFDIGRAAKYMTPGGFIFVDNVAQPGPFFAARDFLSANPGWREIGGSTEGYNASRSFDRTRSGNSRHRFHRVARSERACCKRQADEFRSRALVVAERKGHRIAAGPACSDRNSGRADRFAGLWITAGRDDWRDSPFACRKLPDIVSVPLEITLQGQFTYFTVEPWLIWRGDQPLAITVPPKPLLRFSFFAVSR